MKAWLDISRSQIRRAAGGACWLSVLLLCACGTSKPSRFYLLPNALNAQPGATVDVAGSNMQIGFYPVRISSYLDRPQIVSLRDEGDVAVDEFNRWVAPLDESIRSALAANLAAEMPEAYIDLFPWTVTDPFEYKIMVDVLRMDGIPGQKAVLIAQWTILSSGEEHPPLARRTSVYECPLDDDGYGAYVAGLGNLFQQLTGDIAAFLREHSATPKQEPAPAP